MSKSYVLFSMALGSLALVGCSKEPEPTPVAPPPATAPSSMPASLPASLPATMPDMPLTLPATVPATGPVGAVLDDAKVAVGGLKLPTSLPSDASK